MWQVRKQANFGVYALGVGGEGLTLTGALKPAHSIAVALTEAAIRIKQAVVPTSTPHPRQLGALFGQHSSEVAGMMAGALLTAVVLVPGPAFAAGETQKAPPSAEERELVMKITRLVNAPPHNGSLAAAFGAYDTEGADKALDAEELRRLLKDAGVGNPVTRGFWVDGIIDHMDAQPGASPNEKVDWKELDDLVRNH